MTLTSLDQVEAEATKQLDGIFTAEVHNVYATSTGIRWSLDVFNGTEKRIFMKYSNYLSSEEAWIQLRKETDRIGIPLQQKLGQKDIVRIIKDACKGKQYKVSIRPTCDGGSIFFLRELAPMPDFTL